ncbi:MAG: cytochrome P450 [Acidimicrobiales bacterium]|nr:cytochrome P450 [Acidimicrobiales bacterium]
MEQATIAREEIDFSDHERFWPRPLDERHAAYALLRREEPVSYHPERATARFAEGPGFWALVRHADVLEASRKPDLFSSAQGTSIRDLPDEYNEFFGSMLNMDDPRHARLRGLVSAGFTPRTMAAIERDLHAIASARVDRLLDEGPCDFVDTVAAPLPLTAICRMMGIPDEYHDLVRHQSDIILDPMSTPPGIPRSTAVFEAGRALASLMDEIVSHHLRPDGDDLTSALLRAEVDGQRLTQQEIQSFFVLLTAAGNETTRNASSWGLRLLTDHPDQRAHWMADLDGLAPGAVEELIRFASPVIQFRRTVTRDGVQLGGHTFAEGDKVVLFYESANRDETVFDRPDRFDITRDPNPHVGFGGPGPHFCIGAHLARRQLMVLFKELLTRVPTIVADGPPERGVSSLLNVIRSQRCTWEGA